MDNQLFEFEDQLFTEKQIALMKSGELAPYRPWAEKPTLRQRIASAIRLTSDKDNWVRGIDISKWQGNWTIQKTIDQGVQYAFIKATQNGFTDSKFDANVAIATGANFPFGVYHFCDPGGISAIKQAQYFCNIVDGVGDLSVAADVEWTGGLSTTGLLNWLLDFWGEVGVQLGDRLKETYTRMSFFNVKVAPHDWEADGIGLWVARWADWLEGPWSDGRYIPRDWTDWVNWQCSGDGNGLGSLYGVESADIDLDYFHGDWDAFVNHYKLEDEPIDPEIIERIENLEADMENVQTRLSGVEFEMENVWTKVIELETRIEALEEGEDENPPEYITLTVTSDKMVAFAASGYNGQGKPIIDKNVYAETGDPALKWAKGDSVNVYPEIVIADGGGKWYELYGVPMHGYDHLYGREDQISSISGEQK